MQSAFLDGPTPCTLYMDDTALMATTKSGLESLIAAYVRFCSKFRMRINHDKSSTLAQAERSADSLAGTLRRRQRAAGYVDYVVGAGGADCARWGLSVRRPRTKAACARWKKPGRPACPGGPCGQPC